MFVTPGSRAGIQAAPRLSHGYFAVSLSLGTRTGGTLTPDPRRNTIQHYTNNGAHTLMPPSQHGAMQVDVINNASAGTLSTGGFTKVDGDALDTTNGSKFRLYISVGPAGSHLTIKKMA
jgi:hypothetical protein